MPPCHGHAVLHVPTSFSTFFTEIWRYSLHLSCLYIWFVDNSKVFRIFYIESRIGDEKFASLFFFFPFFSLFDVWVFASDLTVSTRGDGFSTRGDEVCFSAFFFLCLMFGFSHLIWFIETRGDGFSTHGEPVCFSVFVFSFFSLFDVWVFAFDLFHFGAHGDEFSTRGDEVYVFYIWVFKPMLISKIKRPRCQTEQYSQATTFPWFIYPYPWALLSFSKLLLNLFKFYKKEFLTFALK